MAQTFDEILTDINSAQAEFPELNDFNSPSATSIWGLFKKLFALLTMNLQLAFDTYKAEINALIISQQIGTLPWYVAQIKAFQLGDTLLIDDNRIGYAVEDETKQIIAQASASETVESGRARLLFKAVKADETGNLEALSVNELDALSEYVRKIKFAGVLVDVISMPADVVRLNLLVERNKLMLNADGSSITDVNVFPVVDTIKDYLKKLPFDGTLYWNQLIDVLQAMPEVKDAVISQSWYKNSSNNFIAFTRLYNSYSGHLLLDQNSVITYV